MKKSACMMIGTILLSGCSSTILVHEKETGSKDKAVSVKGIPFYVKVEKYEQNTKYEKIWIEATLTVDLIAGTNKKTIQKITRYFAKDQMQEIIDFRDSVSKTVDCDQKKYKQIVNKFNNMRGEVSPDPIKEELISNTLKSMWVVDGSKTYYLNAPLLWFGKNTLSHTLKDDGTLATASSAPDTQLAQGISTLLPVKDFFTSIVTSVLKTSTMSGAGSRSAGKENKYQISIDLEEKGYVYTFCEQNDKKPVGPIKFDIINGFFVREALDFKTEEAPKKSDEKSIGFNGEITLPK